MRYLFSFVLALMKPNLLFKVHPLTPDQFSLVWFMHGAEHLEIRATESNWCHMSNSSIRRLRACFICSFYNSLVWWVCFFKVNLSDPYGDIFPNKEEHPRKWIRSNNQKYIVYMQGYDNKIDQAAASERILQARI